MKKVTRTNDYHDNFACEFSNLKIKVNSHLVLYPVFSIAQSALHFIGYVSISLEKEVGGTCGQEDHVNR